MENFGIAVSTMSMQKSNNLSLIAEVEVRSFLEKVLQCISFTIKGCKVQETSATVPPVQSIQFRQIWLHVCRIFSFR